MSFKDYIKESSTTPNRTIPSTQVSGIAAILQGPTRRRGGKRVFFFNTEIQAEVEQAMIDLGYTTHDYFLQEASCTITVS